MNCQLGVTRVRRNVGFGRMTEPGDLLEEIVKLLGEPAATELKSQKKVKR